MFKSIMLTLFAMALVFSVNALYAADMQGMDSMNMQAEGSTTAQVHQGHGTVNKINAEAGKINMTHDAIPSLKWPKMTMDFKVKSKNDLAQIKPGMKVDFELTVQGKGYQVSRIVPAKE